MIFFNNLLYLPLLTTYISTELSTDHFLAHTILSPYDCLKHILQPSVTLVSLGPYMLANQTLLTEPLSNSNLTAIKPECGVTKMNSKSLFV